MRKFNKNHFKKALLWLVGIPVAVIASYYTGVLVASWSLGQSAVTNFWGDPEPFATFFLGFIVLCIALVMIYALCLAIYSLFNWIFPKQTE